MKVVRLNLNEYSTKYGRQGEEETRDLVSQKHLAPHPEAESIFFPCLYQNYCHLKDVFTCLQQKSQKLQWDERDAEI